MKNDWRRVSMGSDGLELTGQQCRDGSLTAYLGRHEMNSVLKGMGNKKGPSHCINAWTIGLKSNSPIVVRLRNNCRSAKRWTRYYSCRYLKS